VKTHGKKINTRWRARGPLLRYDKRTQDEIDRKYHEPYGWRHGARVRRR
jgi:hypothetical protein